MREGGPRFDARLRCFSFIQYISTVHSFFSTSVILFVFILFFLVSTKSTSMKIQTQESEARPHAHLNANFKPAMTKLQNMFVASVNMDIFRMTLKFNLFTVD